MSVISFFTRICVFYDTERFVTPNTDRGIDGDFQKAYEKVCEKLNSFKIETKLQESRSIIQEQVYKSVESNANVKFDENYRSAIEIRKTYAESVF